ncbi:MULTISPECIES: Crp/Fnr family transcriptional regulator [unclassified Dehalobacter]|uniref:Crp/Fnr family transcriptional regulator n=1 Tax=unclassified Dehalobacter TaxID=2635733 RepID=UPI0003AAAB26|nr:MULTISPECIES: Crp/Fnr family transcriptional regulator [unclassified Dehalobacter]RJE48949.1 Crp/Fnr family transcriptional regulator [Dehalobacter sp. MCB1]TCX50948.1 Crp/Fnr family transcriptional regulator [Dehalobacter sp. 12DCB1]TCX51660.1 Crp/Fnr family transcriptional regulator [Dehalobacter sp. 14DCB1]
MFDYSHFPWEPSSEELFDFMKKNGQRFTVSKGEKVINTGEKIKYIQCVEKGTLKAMMLSKDGRQRTVSIIQAGGIYGFVPVLLGVESSPLEIRAWEDSTICYITKDQAFEKINDNPVLAFAFMNYLSNYAIALVENFESLWFFNPRQRFLLFLRNLYSLNHLEYDHWYKAPYVLTHQEIAESIGATREFVTKQFSDLKNKGMIKVIDRNIYFPKDFKSWVESQL